MLEEGRAPRARRAREGAAQVRPQEGPQGAAVLEAVARRRSRVLRFGTDGVRGDADTDLTTRVRRRARSRRRAGCSAPTRVLVGRDTRASGPRIEADLAAGLRAEGVDAGARSACCRRPRSRSSPRRAGVPAAIVSASHNPWSDNGVKVIGADGRKLADERRGRDRSRARAWSSARPGTGARIAYDAADAVVRGRRGRAPTRTSRICCRRSTAATLDGLARRARLRERRRRSRSARACSAAAGARRATCCTPRPTVATSTTGAARRIRSSLQRGRSSSAGAALGLALDGDADRVLAVDERGELVDGDQIMMMTALDMHERGALRNDAIAVTVMSNLGLRRALRAARHRRRRDAGRRPPRRRRDAGARSRARRRAVGSHRVRASYATTGDGLLTGLLVRDLRARARAGRCRRSRAQMTRVPQVLVNVRVARRVDLDDVDRARGGGAQQSRPSSATAVGCWCGLGHRAARAGDDRGATRRRWPTRPPSGCAAVVTSEFGRAPTRRPSIASRCAASWAWSVAAAVACAPDLAAAPRAALAEAEALLDATGASRPRRGALEAAAASPRVTVDRQLREGDGVRRARRRPDRPGRARAPRRPGRGAARRDRGPARRERARRRRHRGAERGARSRARTRSGRSAGIGSISRGAIEDLVGRNVGTGRARGVPLGADHAVGDRPARGARPRLRRAARARRPVTVSISTIPTIARLVAQRSADPLFAAGLGARRRRPPRVRLQDRGRDR